MTTYEIKTERQLQNILFSIEEYYKANCCTTTNANNDKCMTINQLLDGAKNLCKVNLNK
jgi:hypothetical protein